MRRDDIADQLEALCERGGCPDGTRCVACVGAAEIRRLREKVGGPGADMTDKDPAREAAEKFLGPYNHTDEWMNERRAELERIIRTAFAEALEDADDFRWLGTDKNGGKVRHWSGSWEAVDLPDGHPLEAHTGLTLKQAVRAVRAAIDSARSAEGRGRDE